MTATESPSPPRPDHFLTLILGIVALCAVVATSVVAVMTLHTNTVPHENAEIINIVVGVIGPVITGLLAIALYQVKGAVTEVHVATNSRLTELLKETRDAAHAQGLIQGRIERTP